MSVNAGLLLRRKRPWRRLADLAAVAQIMIGDDAGNHRFPDRYRADADARIVAPLGYDLGLAAVAIDGAARGQDRGGRFHREPRDDRLSGRDAAQNAAGVVRQEPRPAVVAQAALVDVLDHERDRRAARDLAPARLVLEHAGQNSHAIGLAPLAREPRLSGPALVEKCLDLLSGERQARRAAVDHATDRRPVTLAEGGDAKQKAERIERHI